jgi:hypothetical protein
MKSATLRKFTYDRAALIFVMLLVTGVIVFRFYHASVTGYVLPDEAWYYDTFILDGSQIGGYKEVFHAVFLLFFYDVKDISTFFLRGALYSVTWALGSVLVAYRIMRRLEVAEKTAALILLSLPLFPVFTILAVAVIGETLGFFLALLGMYFALRYLQGSSALDAFLSALSFVMAYRVREQYLLLAVGNLILILTARRRNIGALLAYVIPLSLVFPIPVSLIPLHFSQPIYMYLTGLLASSSGTPSLANQEATLAVSITPTVLARMDVFRSFLIGLLFGFNPLFTAFTFISLVLVARSLVNTRSQMAAFVFVNMVSALLSFFASLYVVIGWSSTIIRMSHSSLPTIFGFRYLYEKVKTRYLVAILVIFVLLGSSQLSQLNYAIQRAQTITGEPIDRLGLGYRAPYYRLYLLAKDSGKALVIGGLQMRGIRLYMSMLPNIVVVPTPNNETDFKALLNEGWTTVFLYDDWLTIIEPQIANAYPPYYRDILLSRSYSGYVVETLWVDYESYALRMTKLQESASSIVHPVIGQIPKGHSHTSPFFGSTLEVEHTDRSIGPCQRGPLDSREQMDSCYLSWVRRIKQ